VGKCVSCCSWPSAYRQAYCGSRVEAQPAPEPLQTLTPRERQVLALIAQGRSNQAIGERLLLRKKTVESHVRNIFGKLCLPANAADERRVLAVLRYLQAVGCPGRTQGCALIAPPRTLGFPVRLPEAGPPGRVTAGSGWRRHVPGTPPTKAETHRCETRASSSDAPGTQEVN
jgi:Bacterial regulatory proteins, luxR family